MEDKIKGFLIMLCCEKREWASRGRHEAMSPIQVDQLIKVMQDCAAALEALIKL